MLPGAVGGRLERASRVGLGLAALGRPGYINLARDADLGGGEARTEAAMQRHAAEVMRAAYDAGVRHFDAARSYGLSERFVADWLADEAPEEHFVVTSKWGYTYTADWRVSLEPGAPHEVKRHDVENLRRQAQETRALLPGLAAYQIHSATFASGVLEDADVHRELAKLRREYGWRIGLTVSGVEQPEAVRAALAVEVDGEPLFDTVQATYNVLLPHAGDALFEAHEAGLEVIVKEAVANGRLTERNAAGLGPKLDVLRDAAEALGTDVAGVAIACALKQPFRAVVLSGAATVEQVQANVRAEEAAARLTDDEAARIIGACRYSSAEEYWSERSALVWN